MELQSLREAHRQSIETLKQQSEQELQTLRFELEDEGKAMLGETRGPPEGCPHAATLGLVSHVGLAPLLQMLLWMTVPTAVFNNTFLLSSSVVFT